MILLYAFTYEKLSEERKDSANQAKTIEENKKRINELSSENDRLHMQAKADLKYAIHKEVVHIQSQEKFLDYSEIHLTELIMKHLSFYTRIKSVEDLGKYDFERIVKIAICADYRLLDILQACGVDINNNSDRYIRRTKTGEFVLLEDLELLEATLNYLFRQTITGEYLLLTEIEQEKMENKDYDFIIEEIENQTDENFRLW